MPKAAVIRGDGVGPELVDAMLFVLKRCNTSVELIPCEAGAEWWERHDGDSYIPESTWKILRESNACFKGPTTTIPSPKAPRSVAVTLRQTFDLYANIRPIKTYERSARQLDFICVREATEGLYAGIEFKVGDDAAIAIRKITRKGCERIARKAAEIAVEKGYSKVIAITKRNILKETDGIFIDAVTSICSSKGLQVEEYYIDNMCQQLVKNPERFNGCILLSTNLFMDVVSETASAHLGSIGNVYSANLGDSYAMFEPAHGSAPKYKGLNKMNPTATILSGAWMLEYLGEKDIAKAIFDATRDVINEGRYVTYDLGGNATTSRMSEEIAARAVKMLGR
ncbi:MAG: isocitrate/isopropylmalate dehydrogenase family protein [Candidatus Nitrosocaldus sp.]